MINNLVEVSDMVYHHVPVKEDTYGLLEKYRAYLSLKRGKKISLDETIRELLSNLPNDVKAVMEGLT